MAKKESEAHRDREAVRDGIRGLLRQFDLTYWRTCDKRGTYPREFVRVLAEGGWLGALIPEEYGGQGLGVSEAGAILHEIAASGAGMTGASPIHMFYFPPLPIIRHGSEAMKQRVLPKVALGETLVAFGVTEAEAGVDTSRLRTRAVPAECGWKIYGEKMWITNAQEASLILLLTRTSARDPEDPMAGMTLFLADLDPEYVQVTPIDKLGRAAIDSNVVAIDGLPVTEDQVVGEVGRGFRCLLDGLNPERIVVALEQIGIGRAALDLAVAYARSRIVFDRPIGQNQAIAHPLADSWLRLEAAELVAVRAAELFDAHLPCGPAANMAKYLASEAGFEACDRAMQTLGGYSYAKDYHVERLWREARLQKIGPVSQEMILNYVSTKILDLPRSY